MTIERMEYDEEDFYDGVTTGVGTATALNYTGDSDVQLQEEQAQCHGLQAVDTRRHLVTQTTVNSTA